jgi:acetyl-CoA carboxylase biotin carboxyl carrier protein
MKEHDLNELDLREGERRIQIRRGSEPVVTAGAPPPQAPAGAAAPAVAPPAAEDAAIVVIKSPMVGTFYTAPDPDSTPFVKVGDHVGPETTVCIVEAMKVFNQIPAEVSGKVIAVLVENGQSVEFGQPLFKVDARA